MPTVFPQTYPCTVTFAASATAYTNVPATITVDVSYGGSEQLVTVPLTQQWRIVDLYIRSSSDNALDATLAFVKNKQNKLYTSNPLSSLIISNPSRPLLPVVLQYNGGDQLQIIAANLTANGTSAATDNFFIVVEITQY